MRAHSTARSLGASLITLCAIVVIPGPTADAALCPNVEVLFARGTGEQPGIGYFGKAFVDSLRRKVVGKSIGTYAVDYPADYNFTTSTSAGAKDANVHVRAMAVKCPATRMVLGGHSQGAGVIDLITATNLRVLFLTPAPLPAAAARHVAAVVVFGNPSRNVPGLGPLNTISPQFASVAADMCATGDPFCSLGFNFFAHFSYVQNGMVDQAATFVASRL